MYRHVTSVQPPTPWRAWIRNFKIHGNLSWLKLFVPVFNDVTTAKPGFPRNLEISGTLAQLHQDQSSMLSNSILVSDTMVVSCGERHLAGDDD